MRRLVAGAAYCLPSGTVVFPCPDGDGWALVTLVELGRLAAPEYTVDGSGQVRWLGRQTGWSVGDLRRVTVRRAG